MFQKFVVVRVEQKSSRRIRWITNLERTHGNSWRWEGKDEAEGWPGFVQKTAVGNPCRRSARRLFLSNRSGARAVWLSAVRD